MTMTIEPELDVEPQELVAADLEAVEGGVSGLTPIIALLIACSPGTPWA